MAGTIQECTDRPAVVVDGGEQAEQPMELRWSKTRRKVRAAAKAYGEQTHADY